MSLWVFGYQAVAVSAWLMEDGTRFLMEDGNYWVLE